MKTMKSILGSARKSVDSASSVPKEGFSTFEEAAAFAFNYASEHMEYEEDLAAAIDCLRPPRPGVVVSGDLHGFKHPGGFRATCTLWIALGFDGRYLVGLRSKRPAEAAA